MERGDGGEVRFLNILLFFLIFSINLINEIHDGRGVFGRLEYTLPFLICTIILLFVNNRYVNSSIYLFIALGITIDPSNVSDFSGAIFFIFAFDQVRNKWYAGFVILLTVIVIPLRSLTAGDTIPQNMVMILVFFFIYAIYYFSIYKPYCQSEQRKNALETGLQPDENTILSLLADGYSQKEAGAKMGISQSAANNIIKRIRRKTGYNSLFEIMYHYGAKNSVE